MNRIFKYILLFLLACIPLSVAAEGFGINATRLIYPEGSRSINVAVRNTQTYIPYLVQATVSTQRDKKTTAPFLVTPPLFRLEAKSENQLRISFTGASLPKDRETVFYFHTTAIPASTEIDPNSRSNDVQADVRFGTGNIIKIFFRPQKMSISSSDARKGLIFTRSGNTLTINNPSPYYISFAGLSIAGKRIILDTPKKQMLAPFDVQKLQLKDVMPGKIEWKVINDNGGVDEFTTHLP